MWYNKSSNWYHFTRLRTQKLLNSFASCLIDNGLLHAASQDFDQASLQKQTKLVPDLKNLKPILYPMTENLLKILCTKNY